MTTFRAKPHIRLRNDGTSDVIYNVSGREQVKAATSLTLTPAASSSYAGGAWFRLIQESFPGAWQRNVELATTRDLLRFPPIYTCVTLIADDVAKLRVKLTAQRDFGDRTVWLETSVPDASPFLRVLRKPNEYQTRVQFWQAWMVSKLINGNTYALKARDQRGIVTALYVLDPC
ncbi:MAG TPA: phage portal protein, partial [Burkholderiaceae bacterium]|nr:phage portal protein [Burkholderiaceae bacterium]